MEKIKVGLLGLGTVGTGVVRIIERHQDDLQRQIGCQIEVAKILVKNIEKDRTVEVSKDRITTDPDEIIYDDEIQIVIEVMGGIEEARDYILRSLDQGKHIVTANKNLMATHGREIIKKADEKKCDVFYEASVAGGIPIIRPLVESFSSDRIHKIMGIINGTTNFILTKMSEEGVLFEDVLKEAQALGYAEADPTADVGGLDAAYKIAILATLGFHADVDINDVSVEGITKISKQDVQYAKQLGYEIKLLGIAERDDERISLSVQPTMVKKSHMLASVQGAYNAVYVYGEAVGETMFYGPGAGEMPTATSVVADLVAVAKDMKLGVNGLRESRKLSEKNMKSENEIFSKYFVLVHVEDEVGVMAQIAQQFASCGISIDAVIQQPKNDKTFTEIMITTYLTSKANINQVIRNFNMMKAVRKVASVYRMED